MGRLVPRGFYWLAHREYHSIEQDLEAFSRVTLDDLRRILKEWPFWPMTIVSVGPTTDVHVRA